MGRASVSNKLPAASQLAAATFIFAVINIISASANAYQVNCRALFADPQATTPARGNVGLNPAQLKENKIGANFIYSRNNSLADNRTVLKAAARAKARGVPEEELKLPVQRVQAWLNYLTSIEQSSRGNERTTERMKRMLYKQYVTAPEAIPDSYFDFLVRAGRERGAILKYTEDQKAQERQRISAEQRESLEPWIEYLTSSDSDVYPLWLKAWIISGVTSLGRFDRDKMTFEKRSSGTVTPYPEFNAEALAEMKDLVIKKAKSQRNDVGNAGDVQDLVNNLTFSRAYGHFLTVVSTGGAKRFLTNEGKWVIYKQGSDHMPLVQSIKGRQTGWCTASSSTAAEQLNGGDFHVYYSLDANSQPTIPRIAIRMSQKSIGEIRGVASNQNMDIDILKTNILDEKLKEFGKEAEIFRKKDHDMKFMTQIDKKTAAGQFLSPSELAFLYEVDEKIRGFGYADDPRVAEVKERLLMNPKTGPALLTETAHLLATGRAEDQLNFARMARLMPIFNPALTDDQGFWKDLKLMRANVTVNVTARKRAAMELVLAKRDFDYLESSHFSLEEVSSITDEMRSWATSGNMQLQSAYYTIFTPDTRAIRGGDMTTFKRHLQSPLVDINADDFYGDNALAAAIRNNRAEFILFLKDQPKFNPGASAEGKGPAVRVLNDKTTDVTIAALRQVNGFDFDQVWSSKTYDGRQTTDTLMAYAVRNSPLLAERLIKLNLVDVNQRDSSRTPIWFHLERSPLLDAFLANPKFEINAQTSGNYSVLHQLAAFGKTELITFYLSQPGININAVTSEGTSVFETILNTGRTGFAMELLLRPEIALNLANASGVTAMMLAAKRANPQIIQALLQRPSVNLSLADSQGKTALDYASTDEVRALITAAMARNSGH